MSPAASFYAQLLTPAEQALLSHAPVTPELTGEIALVRTRIALSCGGSTRSAELLVKLLGVLARLVAIQSRAGGLDTALFDLNEEVRREVTGEVELAANL